jgi:hypothetical protein
MGRQVRQVRFFPAFLDAGESELHAADMGQHFEMVLAQAVTQIAGDAVKQRIPAGHDDHALTAEVGFQSADRLLQIDTDAEPLRLEFRHELESVFGAEDQVGGTDNLPSARRQAGHAIAADADDVGFGCRCGHGGSSE